MMKKRIIETFEKWLYPSNFDSFILILLTTILIVISYVAVVLTGGTSFAYLHLFYVPIVFSGVLFSLRGGIIVALLSGFLVGPYMPLIIESNTLQPTHSWVIRAFFFLLIGIISGLGSTIFRAYLKELKNKYLLNPNTQLPNFLGLESVFAEKVATHDFLKIIVVEIKNLNEIEIAIGPSKIDQLLAMMSKDLEAGLPANLVLGHTQRAIFTIILENENLVGSIVEKCNRLLRKSYVIDSIPIYVEEFIGVSSYPDDDTEFSGLFRKALMAINYAATQAKSIAVYDDSVGDMSSENTLLLTELNEAINNNLLHIHYQPKISLLSGEVFGVEALARWTHPILGEISPAKFIPLTERTMLINPFTMWMIEQTFKDMVKWQKLGKSLHLAVNFSLRNFHDKTIIARMIDLVHQLDLDPKKIEIEVTETSFSTNMTEVIKTLDYLRSLGFTISIDDFGTGQASQQYLFQLPIDGLKIDRIFVNELGQNEAATAIVQSAVSLAHQLKLKVVAEGIETKDQLTLLKKMHCDIGQGYLFSSGLPFDELMAWLDKSTKTANSN